MPVLTVPLLGPLHLRWPAFNAVTVRDLVGAAGADVVATTVLEPDALASPAWQDTFELALPLSVVPWLRSAGRQLVCLAEPHEDPTAQADFFRFAGEVPALQQQLADYLGLQSRLAAELEAPLDAARLNRVILPLIREQQVRLRDTAGDGPATGWVWERSRRAAQQLAPLAASQTVVLLAALEDVPALETALTDLQVTQLPLPDKVAVSAEARDRALLDHAMLAGEGSDLRALLDALGRLDSAEAGYARANLLLGSGHAAEALALLEQVSHGDFSVPYFLPGFLLTRLGQLRDLDGNRSGAMQAYRAVLALDWAPAEALEEALAGMEAPFALRPRAG